MLNRSIRKPAKSRPPAYTIRYVGEPSPLLVQYGIAFSLALLADGLSASDARDVALEHVARVKDGEAAEARQMDAARALLPSS